jgi:hypothetical protein
MSRRVRLSDRDIYVLAYLINRVIKVSDDYNNAASEIGTSELEVLVIKLQDQK